MEKVFEILWGVLIVSALLVGGHMIGNAVHDGNRAQHEREITCLNEGGRMENIVGQGMVCRGQ